MIRLANNIKQVNHLSMLTFQAKGLMSFYAIISRVGLIQFL